MFDLFVIHRSIRVEGRGYGWEYALEEHVFILNWLENLCPRSGFYADPGCARDRAWLVILVQTGGAEMLPPLNSKRPTQEQAAFANADRLELLYR
jgi:hypothetical protein